MVMGSCRLQTTQLRRVPLASADHALFWLGLLASYRGMMSQLELVRPPAVGRLDAYPQPTFGTRYSQNVGVMCCITVFSTASTGEGIERSRQKKERGLPQFRFADWIVPPVIVPLLLSFLILATAFHG
jgi:hypothetical protein